MFVNKESVMIVYPVRTGNPKSLGLYERNNGVFTLTNDTSFVNNKLYFVAMSQFLVEVKYGYHKLWGPDSGRNLAGKQTGTLVGIFPKLTMKFRGLYQNEVNFLQPILDNAVQTIVYYDPKAKGNIQIDTYSGDYEIIDKYFVNNDSCKNEPFDCAFISIEKRPTVL